MSDYYQARPADRSTHKIVSPAEQHIANLTWYVFRAINEFIFHDPDIQRIIDEPNIENEKYFMACRQAGYTFGKVIFLPDKIAQLAILTREDFERLKTQAPRRKGKFFTRTIWVWLRILPDRIKSKFMEIFG